MIAEWFRKRLRRKVPADQSDGLTIRMKVRDPKGEVIGRITIFDDGTFSGRIDSGSFQGELDRKVALGFTDGIQMNPVVLPPTPPWKRDK